MTGLKACITGAAMLLLAVTAAVSADAPLPDIDQTINELTARVQDAYTAAYEDALDEFDGLLVEHSGESSVYFGKCRFIQQYVWSEDFFIERSGDDYDECMEVLRDASESGDTRSRLLLLEQEYGAEAIAMGESLLQYAPNWPAEEQARLYETLSYRYQYGGEDSDENQAARYAAMAVSANPSSRLRVQVADNWFTQGAFDKAAHLIESTPSEAWEDLPLYEAASLLLRAGAPEAAAKLLSENLPSEPGKSLRLLQASALGLAGKVDDARQLFSESLSSEGGYVGVRDLRRYMGFEFAKGDRQQATDAYRRFRDEGFRADPVARFRLELALRQPLSAWQWRDLPGIAFLLLFFAAVALLPGVVVAGVHYRSLAKRVRGVLPSEGRWSLRDVWYALAVMLLVGAVSTYVLAYDLFSSYFLDDNFVSGDGLDPVSAARVLVAEAILLPLCLLPLMRRTDLRSLFLGTSKVLPTIGWAILSLLTLRIVTAIYAGIVGAIPGAAALGDVTTFAIQSVHHQYGTLAVFGLVAVVTPVLEEIVFRGVILQGLARYIRFGWAGVIQAIVFACLHESVVAMPIIFAMGCIAAWLVRKTGGLLAPILLHALNNLAAVGVIIAATAAVSS